MIRLYAGPLPAGVPVLVDHYHASNLTVVVVSTTLGVAVALPEIEAALQRLRRELRGT